MKKIVCLVLAMALCLSISAMAESVPSKTVADMTQFDVIAENQPNDPNIFLRCINKATMGDKLSQYQELINISQVEIDKLAAAKSVEEYFGDVKDSKGIAVDLRKMLGLESDEAALNADEFCAVIAGGFKEDCGKVTAKLLFSTPYEKDEKVLVLIGIVTVNPDKTQTVAWQAYEGVGQGAEAGQAEAYGSVVVEFAPETVLAIQNGTALLAVVSK